MTETYKTPCPCCGAQACYPALGWYFAETVCPACSYTHTKHRRGVPKRESDVEDYLVKQAKARGAEVRKVKWLDRDKAPDRVLFMPGGTTLWVEVKSPAKGPVFPSDAHERGQAREHIALRKVGQQVFVVYDYHMVDHLLETFA